MKVHLTQLKFLGMPALLLSLAMAPALAQTSSPAPAQDQVSPLALSDDACSSLGQMESLAKSMADDGSVAISATFIGVQGREILKNYDLKFNRVHRQATSVFMMSFAHIDEVMIAVVDEAQTKVCDAAIITHAEWNFLESSAYGPRASLLRGEG